MSDNHLSALPTIAEGLDAEGLTLALRAWFHLRKRRLPWRDDPSPYRVWLSEIMLQQTQVDTVIPYFERFLDRFPDVQTLAAAPLEDVLSLWSGLGYYRRARMLHAAAGVIVAEHGGRLPDAVADLLGIPGIGRYTAGAIASIAYGRPAPLVDGNVQRVLSRLIALEDPVDGTAGTKALWALAEHLVPTGDPSSHNQGLMELGALLCTPTRPDCPRCPWRDQCRAHARGDAEAFPKKKPRKPPITVRGAAAALRPHAGSDLLLFERRPETGLLAGLWELPSVELTADGACAPPEPDPAEATQLLAHLGAVLGAPLTRGAHLGRVFHQFSHRSLHLDLWTLSPVAPPLPLTGLDPARHRWLSPAEASDAVPLSTLTVKVLKALRDGPPRASRPSSAPRSRPS